MLTYLAKGGPDDHPHLSIVPVSDLQLGMAYDSAAHNDTSTTRLHLSTHVRADLQEPDVPKTAGSDHVLIQLERFLAELIGGATVSEYDAIKAAREVAQEEARKSIFRVAAILNRDRLEPPPGFRRLDTAPHDGTFIRLRFRPGLGRETWEIVGRWQVMEDGYSGWWDREGVRITPGPLFWAPEQGKIG